MGDSTGISWTDATWNPVRGCSRVSEGCRNCYAEQVAARFSGPGQAYEGLAKRGTSTGWHPKWTGEVRMVPEHLLDPVRWKQPRRIFVNSMSDLFHERLTNEQIAAVFGVMSAAPRHTFQVLTKRARRMREWFDWVAQQPTHLTTIPKSPRLICRYHAAEELFKAGLAAREGRPLGTEPSPREWPLPNVWLGVSVENQEAADERIPELLRTPAAVRFLSCEPLLGPVDLADRIGTWTNCPDCGRGVKIDEDGCCMSCGVDAYQFGVDWVIAGCESGRRARPCEVEWLRTLRDQCAAAGVAFFLKQAEHTPGELVPGMSATLVIGADTGSKTKAAGPRGGRIVELPYLDGIQHAAFPAVRR